MNEPWPISEGGGRGPGCCRCRHPSVRPASLHTSTLPSSALVDSEVLWSFRGDTGGMEGTTADLRSSLPCDPNPRSPVGQPQPPPGASLEGRGPTCVRGSALCSTAWAVAWRARAASVTLRSLDVTVFLRTCTFRSRPRARNFRGCKEMQGSGRAWQEGPRGRSYAGGGARAWMVERGPCEHRDAEGQGCETPGWGACPKARILVPPISRSVALCQSASLPDEHVLPSPTAPRPKPWVGVLSNSECLGLREAALCVT